MLCVPPKVLLIAIAGLLFCGPANGASTRLMCMGDSLTQADPGYRRFLYEELKAGGYDVIMVGPKKEKAPDGGQIDHAGFGGYTIGPGPSKGDDWSNGRGSIDANLEDCLKSDPEIILLLIGTNEFFNIGERQPNLDPNRDGPKRLAALVDRIHLLKPDAKILVGSVMPVAWDANFAGGFNAALPALLAGKPNVFFVDTGKLAGFVPGDWSDDKLHPSESGHRKLANVWLNALQDHLKADRQRIAAPMAAPVAKTPLVSSTPARSMTVWNFAEKPPSYGYESWESLSESGVASDDGWKVDARSDGGLGVVLGSGNDLTGYTHLKLMVRKDPGGNANMLVKLLCASGGERSYTVRVDSVTSELYPILIALDDPASGLGDLSDVKQIQIQGDFTPNQKFAYTLGSVDAVSFLKP